MRHKVIRVLATTVFLWGCSDAPVQSTASIEAGVQRTKGSQLLNVQLDPFPEVAAVLPELQVVDVASFRDRDANELAESVRQAGGRVVIGLKPVVASRTSLSGRVPGMTRAQVMSARSGLKDRGVALVRGFANIPAVVAEIDPHKAADLVHLPFVNYVEPVLPGGHLLAQDTSWGVKKIRAPLAWSTGQRGNLSSVTIIDAGIDLTHLASGDGPNGFSGDCVFTVTNTCYWTLNAHGVLVAGVIAGRDNEQGYVGIAPDLGKFASVKVVSDNGSITHESVAAALDWAVSRGFPRHIVNMSIGFCQNNATLATAVQAAASAGLLMIAPVGNSNIDCGSYLGMPLIMYPARYEQVIAVSGTTEDDTFWGEPRLPCGTITSKFGWHTELSAPNWTYSMVGQGDYYWDCWTSYAAAAVTGVAALAWTKYPALSAAQLRTHLRSTAVDLGSPGYDYHFGYGRVDAANAVGYQPPPPPPPPPPPFAVTITGPSEIKSSIGCDWSAQVSGGTPPYSYSWRIGKQMVGTDSPHLWYVNNGASFTLGVIVSDALGAQGDDSHAVTINSGAACL